MTLASKFSNVLEAMSNQDMVAGHSPNLLGRQPVIFVAEKVRVHEGNTVKFDFIKPVVAER